MIPTIPTARWRDYPVVVATSAGPIGGVVTEPTGARRAALVFLQGAGEAGRSGINSIWARTARAAAELGIVTLRADYPGIRESHMAVGQHGMDHFLVLQEVVGWFRRHVGEGELLVAGACYGARLAVEYAAFDADVTAVGLVVPHLRATGPAPAAVDDKAVAGVRTILARAPVWCVFGEQDADDVFVLKQLLGADGDALEAEVVPGLAMHWFNSAAAQRHAVDRIVAWLRRTVPPPEFLVQAAHNGREHAPD